MVRLSTLIDQQFNKVNLPIDRGAPCRCGIGRDGIGKDHTDSSIPLGTMGRGGEKGERSKGVTVLQLELLPPPFLPMLKETYTLCLHYRIDTQPNATTTYVYHTTAADGVHHSRPASGGRARNGPWY